MNADMQITLTTDPKDPNTVFRLHPIIKEGDEIQFETYARIEHVLSGFWLHALRGILMIVAERILPLGNQETKTVRR